MNALECRTLAATCMHALCTCIAWLTVFACSISGTLNYIPCTWTWLWHCSSLFRVLGVGKGTWLYVTIQTKSFCDNLNWIMHFTLSLHWQLISKAQNCNQWGKSHVNTDGQQLHTTTPLGRTYMTTIPLCLAYLKCVFSLRWPLPFSIGGLRRMDRWMDRQTKIAKRLQ